MTDAEIRERLRAIDESDMVDVDSWEAGFIKSMVYAFVQMSEKQRAIALEMIERYEV